MRKFLSPFMLLFTLFVVSAYCYARYQLSPNYVTDVLIAVPFLSIWLTPVLFWFGDRAEAKPWAHSFQRFSYFSMGWLNFVFLVLIPINLMTLILRMSGRNSMADLLDRLTLPLTLLGSGLALLIGYTRAMWGPGIRELSVPLAPIAPSSSLDGLRIVQISDLHVSPMIRQRYVEHVTAKCNALDPDLIVLTGDIVDGSIKDLLKHAMPLAGLRARLGVYLILGNHDYYSGAQAWVKEFEAMGMTVLLNEHRMLVKGGEEFMLAGVIDPAAQAFSPSAKPDPFLARGHPHQAEDRLRILLAHNPQLASEAARAGFHLQISGHTHAGQFIPWTWVTRLVHKPHYAGLSKEKDMTVYVSAGTGSWGPPLRLGTSPEVTLLKLTSAAMTDQR